MTNIPEISHLFDIARDIAAARARVAKATDDLRFHLNELSAMQMHTNSNRLRDACSCITAMENANA